MTRCSPLARLLFLALSCLADHDGRLKDRPLEIKADALPNDPVNVDDLLQELHVRRLITRYEAGGISLIQVSKDTETFRRHARPHPKEHSEGFLAPSREIPRNPVEIHGVSSFLQHSTLNSNTSDLQLAAAAAELVAGETRPTADWSELVSLLIGRGLSPVLAQSAAETADPALIRESVAYHARQPSLRNPVGALRSMLAEPESWGFERTSDGWKQPVDALPTGEAPTQRAARLERERQAAVAEKDAARASYAAGKCLSSRPRKEADL